MLRGQSRRPASLPGDNYSEGSTSSGEATPPTTVSSPSVQGDGGRGIESQRTTLMEPQTPYHVEPKQSTPTPSILRRTKERIYFTYRAGMQIVDYLGRILVAVLIAYLLGLYLFSIQPTNPFSFAVIKIKPSVASSTSTGSSKPLPNHTYIIRSKLNGKILDRRDGQVFLANRGTEASSYWDCVETNGWLGFRDTQFPRAYLGHNSNLDLEVTATSQKGWESFTLRFSPSGGYMLQMVHYVPFYPDELWYVGLQGGNLAKISDRSGGGIIWEFIEV